MHGTVPTYLLSDWFIRHQGAFPCGALDPWLRGIWPGSPNTVRDLRRRLFGPGRRHHWGPTKPPLFSADRRRKLRQCSRSLSSVLRRQTHLTNLLHKKKGFKDGKPLKRIPYSTGTVPINFFSVHLLPVHYGKDRKLVSFYSLLQKAVQKSKWLQGSGN